MKNTEYLDQGGGVIHANHPCMDMTLCGCALEGNPIGSMGANTRYEEGCEPCNPCFPRRITCRRCLETFAHCRSFPVAHTRP
jgi:hypothetical protein